MYVYPGRWCGTRPACLAGAENLCREMRIMGFHRDGGFAEGVTAPAQSLIPVSEGLPPEEAVFAEPLSCCLNALDQAGNIAGKTVGIWGAGPAGTLLSRAAAARGAKGETPEEIAGAWQAIDDLDTVHARVDLGEPLVENSGTGMDQLKTFNVSSATAIVAAAG